MYISEHDNEDWKNNYPYFGYSCLYCKAIEMPLEYTIKYISKALPYLKDYNINNFIKFVEKEKLIRLLE